LNKEVLAAGQPVVSDYVFNKELIYADRLLDRQQLSMYKKVYRHVAGQIVQPVLVIYLVDSPENCLKRIHGRNRPYEQAIELKFLEAIGNDYERMFANWQVCPVIRLATPQIDYGEPSCIQHLMDQLKYYIATANA
jgi:deoxyadenosine/deoxycytidine kinase